MIGGVCVSVCECTLLERWVYFCVMFPALAFSYLFIIGRYIGENMRTFCDILDNTNELDITGIMFYADFEKPLIVSIMYSC